MQGKSNRCDHCALGVTSVVHVLIHVYSIACLTVYRAEVGVYVFTLIQLACSTCMASLCVHGKSNRCDHCALGVTSVVHVLIHVYSIACLTVYRAEVGVYVFTLIQLAWSTCMASL